MRHSFKPLVSLKKKNNNENNYNLTMESNLLKNRCKKMNKINKLRIHLPQLNQR